MRFLRELADPWGLLLAAASAGAAWAVQLPVVVAVGVGGAVLLTKAGVSAWLHRGRTPSDGPRSPLLDPESVEGRWVWRAEQAADDFDNQRLSLPAGPLAEQVASMAPSVEETLDTLRRLAGRAATTAHAMGRIDTAALVEEQRRLERAREAAGSELHDDLERALASVAEQRAAYDRLSAAHAKVLAQLQSGVIGLEGLVTRLVELGATADSAPRLGTGTIEELTDRLEGIRRGVVETEEATRNSLGGL